MKIYIATHKVVDLPVLSEVYEPLLVGSFNKDIHKYLRDDCGENISAKNPNYCELTGIYWIWKNVKEDIVGLCHYRRFLSKSLFSKSSAHFISEDDLEKDMVKGGIDIILPQKHYFTDQIISEKSTAPNMEDMKVVRGVINDLYPEYIAEYDHFVSGCSAYLYNVVVAKKPIFDAYCQWLFDILFETEKRMNPDTYIHDSYRKRMFGFISERLFNVWIMHNQNVYRIKEYQLVNTDRNLTNTIKDYSVQRIRRKKGVDGGNE